MSATFARTFRHQSPSIITRMMAKRPEDRFGSYDELIGALDEAPLDRNEQEQGIALLPLDGEPEPAPPALHDETNPDRESDESERNGSGDATYQVVSLADLASELDEDYHPQPASRQPSVEPPAPLLRRTPLVENDVEDTDSTEPNAAESALPSRPPRFRVGLDHFLCHRSVSLASFWESA